MLSPIFRSHSPTDTTHGAHMFRLIALLTLSLVPCSLSLAAEVDLSGTLMVVNRDDSSIAFYDLPTQREATRLAITGPIPHEIAASPNGELAVTSEYGTGSNPGRHLVVIDVATAEIVRRIDMGANSRPHSMVFLDDNRHVITTLELREAIALVDVIDGTIVRTYATGGRDSHMVRVTPDNRYAFVAARGSGTLSRIDLEVMEDTMVLPTGARAEGIAIAPDGSKVWVANQNDSTITIVDAGSMAIIGAIGGIAVNRAEVLANGIAVIPGGTSDDAAARYVTYFDGTRFTQAGQLTLPASNAGGTGIRVYAANNTLFLADSAVNEVSAVVPAFVGERTVIAINPDNVDGMAWSPVRVDQP